MTAKLKIIATVLSSSLCGGALATPEQCANLLQQADGYDPYVCGAESLHGIVLPDGMDVAKDGIVQYGSWKVTPEEDDDLIARLPSPRPDEGPYTAVIQNEDQSSMHTASVSSLGACRGLAKSVLASQISYEVEAHKRDKDDEMDIWGRVISSAAPTEVVCVPSYGKPVTYTVFGLAQEIEK